MFFKIQKEKYTDTPMQSAKNSLTEKRKRLKKEIFWTEHSMERLNASRTLFLFPTFSLPNNSRVQLQIVIHNISQPIANLYDQWEVSFISKLSKYHFIVYIHPTGD
jgi:hypothetical protein